MAIAGGSQGPSHLGGVSGPVSDTSTSSSSHSEYLQQLCSLNTSVSQWISRHVSGNPYVDLTPIFKDYETHLRNIDAKVGKKVVQGCLCG